MTSELKQRFAQDTSKVKVGMLFSRAASSEPKTGPSFQRERFAADLSSLPEFIIHITHPDNLRSIDRQGLIPGGTQGKRQHVMFVPLFYIIKRLQHLRNLAILNPCGMQISNCIEHQMAILLQNRP